MRQLTEKRKAKFLKVSALRQPNLTVILENVVDTHNIGAVLRTCDAVGIMEVYAVYSGNDINKDHLILGKRTTKGTRKWVDVHLFNSLENCFKAVRKKYDVIIGSEYIPEVTKSLYSYDLTQSVALVFGNEQDGVSEECLAMCDETFTIPQVGMVESLNISVACAVSLYEAYRQREQKGFYSDQKPLNAAQAKQLFENYEQRSFDQVSNRKIKSTD